MIKELAARGYKAVNTDDHGLSEWVAVPLDEPTGLGPGQDWLWREDRIQDLLSTRTTNPYGKHPDEVARVLALQQMVEPLLRAGAELEVDTSAPLDQVVTTVLQLVQSPPAATQPA